MKTHTGKKHMRALQISLFTWACLLGAGLLMPAMLQAAPAISARYVQARGTQLAIEITIGSNPPASAILIQQLPPGVRILAAQPGFSSYNANRNRAKWLLRQPGPGTSTVTMTLDRAVSANEIAAEIRFKPQQGGKMTTIQVGR